MGDSIRFARAARLLAGEARRQGLEVPGFRSPPRLAGADRSLRRGPGTTASVAVRLRDRVQADVLVDMVEGVVVANGLSGAAAERCRRLLEGALAGDGGSLSAGPAPAPTADRLPPRV